MGDDVGNKPKKQRQENWHHYYRTINNDKKIGITITELLKVILGKSFVY